jgi:peptidoglycan hydrolase CwlO-like protein
MSLFGKKRGKFVDLSEGYSRHSPQVQPRKIQTRENEDNSSLGFLGNLANSGTSANSNVSWDNDSPSVQDYADKKQKLAKRLLDMTDKIEDLSNQIYHLKQRIELLEKKLKINFQ